MAAAAAPLFPLALLATPGPMLRRLSLIAVVVAVAGCTPPWKQAYVRGENAIASARYDDAAIAFSESCELDGAASDACVRAKTLRRRAVADAVGDAEKVCRSDLGRCLDRLRTARGLAVHERALGEQVEAVLDDASARHVQRCEAQPERTYQATMIAARCVALHEEAVGTTAHRRRVDEALARLADGLSPAVRDGGVDGRDDDVAFAAVRHGLAQCYAPTPARAAAVVEARQKIVERHQAGLVVSGLEGLPRSFVDVVCGSEAVARAPVRCGVERGSGRVVLDVAASLGAGRVGHSTRDTDKVIRYVHHIEERPNPEYPRVRDRVATLQDQTRAAATTLDAAKIDCDGAEDELRVASYCYDCEARARKDRLCAREDAAERAHREVKNLLSDEESRLRMTDEVLRIPHHADFAFTETRHTWEQAVRVEARCAEPTTKAFAQPPLQASRTIRFEDDTHVGFARAGLAEDPLVEPTGAMFADSANGIAREELVAFVGRCLDAFAADAGRCGDPLDCFQRRALYRGEDPVVASIGSFADVVDKARPDLPRFPCRAPR